MTSKLHLFAILLLCAANMCSWAHKQSDAFIKLSLQPGEASVLEISLRDLEYAVGLDRDGDLEITWGEVRLKTEDIKHYAAQRLTIEIGAQRFMPEFAGLSITDHSDGRYAALNFSLPEFPIGQPALVRYGLLFEIDLQHRGLLRLSRPEGTITHVFSPNDRTFRFEPGRAGNATFPMFFKEGVWHIWKGFDHVLFLIALLLPAVLVRRDGHWEAAGKLSAVFFQVIKVVTAFTLAHSVTLTLAVLGLVTIPAKVIEPIIAASVVLAALNNVFGWFQEKLWGFAFGFGLVHGFGFAFVLQDLGLDRSALFTSLFGFNLGVEAGQLAIVAVVVPAAFLVRCTPAYRGIILRFGSASIALVAATWMFERVLEFKILPF